MTAVVALSFLFWFVGSMVGNAAGGSRGTPPVERRPSAAAAQLVAEADSPLDAAMLTIEGSNRRLTSTSTPQGRPTSDAEVPSAPVDPEWSSFPRTEFSIGWWLSPLGPAFDAEPLFRHRTLNPTDTYIPAETRRVLQTFLDSLRPELEALDAVTGLMGDREAHELFDVVPHQELTVTARQWQDPTGTVHDVGLIPLSEEEPMVIVGRSGKSFGISVRDLPGMRGLNERRASLILEIGNAITIWFRATAMTPASAVDAVMADVAAWSERKRLLSVAR